MAGLQYPWRTDSRRPTDTSSRDVHISRIKQRNNCTEAASQAGAVAQQVQPPLQMPAAHMGAPVQVLPVLLPTSSLLAHLARQQKWLEYLGPCHPCGKPRWSSCPLAPAWPSSGYCGHLGSEPTEDLSLSLVLPLQLINTSLKTKRTYSSRGLLIPMQCTQCEGLSHCVV